MMILLNQRTNRADLPLSTGLNVVEVGQIQKEEWHSITLKDEKIGYSNKVIQATGNLFLVNETTYLRLPVGGVLQEILMEGIYTVDSAFSIRTFNFTFSSEDYEVMTNGVKRGNELKLGVTSGEKDDHLTIPVDGELFAPALIPEFLAMHKFIPTEFRINTFDPFTMAPSTYLVQVFRKYDPQKFGTELPVYHVYLYFSGFMSEMWIEEDGDLIIEKAGEGFSLYRTTRDDALSFTMNKKGSDDLLRDFAIPADSLIPEPREVVYLKLKVEKLQHTLFELNDFNQRYDSQSGTLEIYSPGFEGGAAPDSTYLATDPFIQVEDQRIHSSAREITAGITDTLEMLRAINNWLFENIEKSYTLSIPYAVEILNKRKGDCNEHAILFTALARSLGIPTTLNTGVLYMEEKFFYHMWNQAYANGSWHTFDATLRQNPADATHIKLVSGNLQKQIQLLRIGVIKISVLEFSTDPEFKLSYHQQ